MKEGIQCLVDKTTPMCCHTQLKQQYPKTLPYLCKDIFFSCSTNHKYIRFN